MSLLGVWEGQGGWIYKVYSPDTPYTDLGRVGRLKRIWDGKRRTDAIPAWKDFKADDFSDWYGCIKTEDIGTSKSYKILFDLWRTLLENTFGIGPKDRHFNEWVSTLYEHGEPSYWSQLGGTHNIITTIGTMNWLPENHHYHDVPYTFITLPLAEDGEKTDKYVSALRVY